MAKRKKDGRSSDLSFSWLLTTHGPEWAQWQQFAAEWMAEQDKGTDDKRKALTSFFDTYLLKHTLYAVDVTDFFQGKNGHRCSTEELIETLKASGISGYRKLADTPNYICDFIDWVIKHHFSAEDDNGELRPIATNPFAKVKKQGSQTETVRNPLPYRYIQDLQQILCPQPSNAELKQIEQALKPGESLLPPYRYRHFKDWSWAQQQSGQGNMGGDWFEVDPALIDKADPDCVWRTKEVTRNRENIIVHQLWSPVKAMMIFVKLHLPLRTYQVRFLDSGEADTWRYKDGNWEENTAHEFALGTPKRPFAKGVFKRIYDSMSGLYSTGLYISTNKTADQNKDEVDRGYTIPWQHEEVLYWLEKLRNWQEKYNPIAAPTACTTLVQKHFSMEKSDRAKAQMGDLCFLLRDASANGEDRQKPIGYTSFQSMWYQLLLTLQNQLEEEGHTLDDGSCLKLVEDYPEGTQKASMISTLFPLHSLRVSLITAYTMDTELPLPVISKLLAGHTRLLMTIYYNKITPSVMAEKMAEAEQALEDKSEQSVRTFLKDASQAQIQWKMAYNNEDSVMAALANRNPIGWEYRAHGLCLVGGNTVKSDEVSTIGGCWNGGELVQDAKAAANRRYAPVPHGPENCVRCRWFVTDASFLPALNALFNQLSYKAHQAANLSVEIEGELEVMKDEAFFAEEQGMPFTQQGEIQALQRRYEKQQVEADEYAKDWIATFNLIQRILHLEENRAEGDSRDKLVALGSQQEVSHSLKFIETDSELLHLSLLCDDAEFYPDLQDDLRKTPAIQKRTLQLSRIMMRKGYAPIFMEMDDRMQLVAANAMMRKMAKLADPDDKLEGYRKVAGYLEAETYLRDQKLLEAGLSALQEVAPIPLTNNANPMLESA